MPSIFVLAISAFARVAAWEPQVFEISDLSESSTLPSIFSELSSAGVILLKIPSVSSENLVSVLQGCELSQFPLSRTELPHGQRLTLPLKAGESTPPCASQIDFLRSSFSSVARAFSSSFLSAESEHLTFLDHLHLYLPDDGVHSTSSTDKYDEALTVPFHTDRGVFLVMTAAAGLSVEVAGEEYPIPPSAEYLVLMAGVALRDFLDKRNFVPCVHGVHSTEGPRGVFARMYLFEPDFKNSLGEEFGFFFSGKNKNPPSPWRRLMEQQCKADEKMCWHQCMKIEGCAISDAVCWDKKKTTLCDPNTHNSNCGLICPAFNAAGVPSLAKAGTEFCFGSGTSMFMDGFQSCLFSSESQPCVLLFTEKFLLNSVWKFLLGCAGVFFLGASVEGIVVLRKRVVMGRADGRGRKRRKMIAALLFGANLTIAYLIMLVAMTYSIELFFAVIAGLVVGHLAWKNEQDAAKYESPEPCCITAPNSTQVTASLAHNCQCA